MLPAYSFIPGRKLRIHALPQLAPASYYPFFFFFFARKRLPFLVFSTCAAVGLFLAFLSVVHHGQGIQEDAVSSSFGRGPNPAGYLQQPFPNSALHIRQEEELKTATTGDPAGTHDRPVQRRLPAVTKDVILLPDDVVLLLIDFRRIHDDDRNNNESSSSSSELGIAVHNLLRRAAKAESLGCFFPETNSSTEVSAVDFSHGKHMVRCRIPTDHMNATKSDGDESWRIRRSLGNVSLWILPNNADIIMPTQADEAAAAAIASAATGGRPAKLWSELVFEIWHTAEDVVLFAKGINNRQGKDVSPAELACVYGGGGGVSTIRVETAVTESAQEVFRCEHPPAEMRGKLRGEPVTLRWGAKEMPSVVYYEGGAMDEDEKEEGRSGGGGGGEICVCTMVYNVAKFIKEWASYHAHAGVGLFVIYDNGSEDELGGALRWLREERGVRSRRRAWPWPKTQEAGLSHCAAAMRSECEWVAFIDVDEFVYVKKVAAEEAPPPMMKRLTAAAAAEVGQIWVWCRDFGPSGRKEHPAEGVTQGYTCRAAREERHKAIVRVAAVANGLRNAVHHFDMAEGWRTDKVGTLDAVVNHYKYQAWPEFRQKFRRRVSAYVADWAEERNMESKDRTPGLGRLAIKPDKWERAFCDVDDTQLRDYVRRTFLYPLLPPPGGARGIVGIGAAGPDTALAFPWQS